MIEMRRIYSNHALSLLRKVSGLSHQRRESHQLRSSTSGSSIFVVVGLLSAAVTHQVRGAFLHVRQSVCVELTAEGLTCCHWFWTFQKTTQDQLAFLIWLSISAEDTDDSVMYIPMTYMRIISSRMMMMMFMIVAFQWHRTTETQCAEWRLEV